MNKMRSQYFLGKICIFILGIIQTSLCLAQEEVSDTLILIDKKQQKVNIGFDIQPEWMITGAVSSINDNILKKSFTSDLRNSLTGTLSGLTIINGGGEPGLESPTIRIRGLNTFGSGKDILVLVDGFEFPLTDLDPDEIESATLLKDAAATAIYGSKGANGVLLVTTKRGEVGPLRVSFNIQHGYNQPDRVARFLGSYDFATLYNEALVNDGKAEMYSPSDIEAYRSVNDPFLYPDVNWYDEVLRKMAPMTKYGLSFKGGDKSVKYSVFLGLLNQDGLIKKGEDLSDFTINSNYRRFNFRSNVDINFSSRLTGHLTLGGTIEDGSNPTDYSTENIFNTMSLLPPNAFPVYNPNGTFGGSNLYSNPWGDILETGMYTTNGRIFQGIFKLTEQLDMITKGLSISGQVGFNTTFTSYSSKSRSYASFAYSVSDLGDTLYTKIGEDVSLTSSEGQSDQWRSAAFRVFLNYNRSFGNHDVSGILMFNTSDYNVGVGNLPFLDKGLFGRFTYAINKKYISEITFGYNGSDNFPRGSRWGLFPAISLGWIVSNEEFLKGNNSINFLKLRGSYGLVGNDKIGGTRWMYWDDWGGVGNYYFGVGNTSFSSFGEKKIAVSDITWEKQKQLNIGIEATLLNNFEFSLDVFKQTRNDILAKPNKIVPSLLGLALPDLNVGKIENKGFEMNLRYNSDEDKPLQFFAQANLWFARNKIIDNSEALQLPELEYLYRSGHSVGQPFVFEAIGFFRDDEDIATSPRQVFGEVRPGDLKYKDQNGDGIIDNTDVYPIGRPNLPEITLGLSSGFSFKGFDMNVIFQGITNYTIYLGGSYFEAFQNNGKVSRIALGRWTESTKDEATFPRLSSQNNMNNYQNSSFWQRDGSFIKLRSLELGYTFYGSIFEKFNIDNARIYLNGTNLFTLDKLTANERNSSVNYPSVKTYSLGLKFQFIYNK